MPAGTSAWKRTLMPLLFKGISAGIDYRPEGFHSHPFDSSSWHKGGLAHQLARISHTTLA
jgi:hypothetical protein